MAVKLFDSELKVMDVLWKEGDMPAKQVSDILKETTGWNMNTTYTVIKKCIAKGAIERREPNFLCHALIARDVVQAAETEELLVVCNFTGESVPYLRPEPFANAELLLSNYEPAAGVLRPYEAQMLYRRKR